MKISNLILSTLVLASLNGLGQSTVKKTEAKNPKKTSVCTSTIAGYSKMNSDTVKVESGKEATKKFRNTCGKCGKG